MHRSKKAEMEHAFVPWSILFKILSLFVPHLSEFWVSQFFYLASLQLLNYIMSFIRNDNVDEVVNVGNVLGTLHSISLLFFHYRILSKSS